MKTSISFSFMIAFSILNCQSQHIAIINSSECNLYPGIDNYIQVKYDISRFNFVAIESDRADFSYFRLNDTALLIRVTGTGEFVFKFKFQNKINKTLFSENRNYFARSFPSPVLRMDGLGHGDTLYIHELDSLKEFRIDFALPNLTLHRSVKSFSAVYIDTHQVCSAIESGSNISFNAFKEKLKKVVNGNGILVLYDIVVQIEGKPMAIAPVQIAIRR